MLRSAKFYSLNLEFPADEREKIDPGYDHVAAQDAGRFVVDSEVGAEFFENFGRQECDLALVILSKIKVAIAPQAAASHTLNLRYLFQRKAARRLAVMADEIVAGRDKNLPDQHRTENEWLADAKSEFANDLAPKALFQFAQDLRFGDLLELIVQRGLEHSHRENAPAQTDWR